MRRGVEYARDVAEDLLPLLTRFHREIFLPDMQRLVGDFRQAMNARFDEVNARFGDLFGRLDRLETEQETVQVEE
jgi:hypothetical protein